GNSRDGGACAAPRRASALPRGQQGSPERRSRRPQGGCGAAVPGDGDGHAPPERGDGGAGQRRALLPPIPRPPLQHRNRSNRGFAGMSRDTSSGLNSLLGGIRSAASPFRAYLTDLYNQILPNRDGRVADYIPELAKANPDHFAISVVTVSGTRFSVGDASVQFTIQSVSKPFVYGLALEDNGRERTLS